MAKTTLKSVNEYIASKPKDVRVMLERVRGAIRRAVPAAQEAISYQMPVYMLDGVPVLYFAGWKHHSPTASLACQVECFQRSISP